MKALPLLPVTLVLFLAHAAAAAPAQMRTWTAASGKTIEAGLVDVSRDGNTLTLIDADGQRFQIRTEKLSAADRQYVQVTRIRESGASHVVYQGEHVTFTVDRKGVLCLRGTGKKTTWPKGRLPKAQRSRHTGKLIPVKPDPSKPAVVVDEPVAWTETSPADLIAMLEKVVARAKTAVEGRGKVERYRICGGLELSGDHLCGLSIWFEADAALMDLPRGKREMRYKQGDLTSATLTINTHDGKASSDLTELSETLNETQQRTLLQALRDVPFHKLGGQ